MTRYSLLILLVVSILFCQCIEDTSGSDVSVLPVAKDTLTYSLERLSQIEPGCMGDTCTQIQINFIQFQSGDDSLAIQKLNQNILNNFRGDNYTNVIAYINGFIREYQQDKAEFPDLPQWSEESNQKVVFNHPNLIGLVTNHYRYRGGAHPDYVTVFNNYDPHTGNELSWTDLIQPGEEKEMIELGESYFRTTYEISKQEALKNSEFQFKDGQFYLPDNFIFDQSGLLFLYPLYEIGPYAAGEHEFILPYAEIKKLLKPEYVSLIQ